MFHFGGPPRLLARLTETTVDPRPAPRLAETYAEVEDALLSRWPETRLEPSLDRIRAFATLLGDPQQGYPAIHLTGTNGKTSTSRMIDTLLRALDLRTGRFTSPHVERMAERISVDGEPLTDEEFVRAFNDIAPYTHIVDASEPFPLSFFETIVGMAYAAFADAPVDVAVVEVGMGGAWDATNVIDAAVAVVLPIAVDHAKYLGNTPEEIAVEKAGIIKPGSVAILAEQSREVAAVLLARVKEVGATVAREGVEFGVTSRAPAVGGQVMTLRGLRQTYDEVFLPLYGAHQAQNAVGRAGRGGGLRRRPAARRRGGARGVRERHLARSARGHPAQPHHRARRRPQPARRRRRWPPRSTTRSSSRPLIGVVGVMADKDDEGVLAAFEPHFAHVICTQNSTPRARAGRGAGGDRDRDLRRGPGDRRAPARRRHRPGGGARRGGGGVRRPARLRRRAHHRLGGHGRRGSLAADRRRS